MSNSETEKIRREIIDSKIEKSRLQGNGHSKFKGDLEKRLKLLEDKELQRQENRRIKRKCKLEKEQRSSILLEAKQVVNIVMQHISMLVQERNHSFIINEHGNKEQHKKKWEKDIVYFYENNILNKSCIIKHLTLEMIISIIDRKVTDVCGSYHENIKFDKRMGGYNYEKFCAKLLIDNNWDAIVTQSSGDQGVDIVARKATRILVVQCKLYGQPVGNGAVQEIHTGKAYKNANEAIVVTNNIFTRSAKELALACNVKLMHHDELSNY